MTEPVEKKDETLLPNILAVVDYLKVKGIKVSKSAAYQHQREGKIRAQKSGGFKIKDVDRYAVRFLKGLDGGKIKNVVDENQTEKLEAETSILQSKARHWEIKAGVQEGRYVERSVFERELAARALVFRTDLENFCRSKAGAIIHLVGGNTMKEPDLIDYLLDQADIWIGRYAEDREFTAATGNKSVEMDPDDDEDE